MVRVSWRTPTFIGLLVFAALIAPAAQPSDSPYGIDKRILWTHSHVIGSPNPPPPYQVKRAFPKLTFNQPLSVITEPGSGDLLVTSHDGGYEGPAHIVRLKNQPDADKAEPFLDINRIVYGLAFHPDYAKNHYIYAGSNGPDGGKDKKDRVSRFTVDDKRCDPKSELVILEWESDGHNGGDVGFGPDGFLYVTSGDGTSDSDGNLRGQDLTKLTAKVLRLDVDHPADGKPYSVPKDNPFVDRKNTCPETWAYGFRNPWRMTFDRKTGRLWVGQNGQDLWEQAYVVHKGDNCGWSVNEGSHPFQPDRARGPDPIVMPAVEHHHSVFRSLTGGVVYYGKKYPALDGAYIYGDYSTGAIWAARNDGTKTLSDVPLADSRLQIVGFGIDPDGELLIVDHAGGLYTLETTPKEQPKPPFPTKLSETGLFASVKGHQVDPGLIPYDVNAPLWSDGASKERFIALPGDGKIEFADAGGWNFPEGAVLVKTFSLNVAEGNASTRRRIETRLFTKQNGQWQGYSYLWNDAQTDAELVADAGVDRVYEVHDSDKPGASRKQTWHYPSRAECMVCHSRAANWVLGLSTMQMNKVHDYGAVKDEQLRTLEHLGVFKVKLEKPLGEYPRLTDPAETKADLSLRARSYLQANCAQCHIHAGGGNSLMDLEFTTSKEEAHLFGAHPQHQTFGIVDPLLIAPGEPDRSVLLQRVARRGPNQMPPMATSVVDEEAVRMLREWIAGMK
jgi:uncharacterized repeat protein (TIGR03806 family)